MWHTSKISNFLNNSVFGIVWHTCILCPIFLFCEANGRIRRVIHTSSKEQHNLSLVERKKWSRHEWVALIGHYKVVGKGWSFKSGTWEDIKGLSLRGLPRFAWSLVKTGSNGRRTGSTMEERSHAALLSDHHCPGLPSLPRSEEILEFEIKILPWFNVNWTTKWMKEVCVIFVKSIFS